MVAAALGGTLGAAGYAPTSFWPGTVLAVACLGLTAVLARTARQAALNGTAFGLALTSITLNWMRLIDLGAAAGLVVAISAWYAVLGVATNLARRTRWWPLLASGLWVLMEYAASRFPFGGFGWLRLGYTMIDSPLSGLFPLVGVGGVSLATAIAAQSLVWVGVHPSPRRATASALTFVALLGSALAGAAVPASRTEGTITLGWVQGGAPGGGVFGIGPARSTAVRHATQTTALGNDIRRGDAPQPDAVIWPENSTDLDPGADPMTRRLIENSVAAVNAPILVGTILNGPGADQRQTASQWWSEQGAGARYIKRSLVPFGEWIPFRDILLPLIPELRYVGAQSVPGTLPGILSLTLRDGRRATVGVLLCFDVAFDQVAYDLPTGDAQIVVVQSSNAMYQGSSQVDQQFAITRARAAELRREVLVVTTSGISGLIDPYGTPSLRIDRGAASGVATIALRSGATPAALIAVPLQQASSLVSLGWLGVLAWRASRQRLNGHRALRDG
jgi:apolipoprotein N-acyltransferase